jgi:tetratricopeptide (TPR) repeat protein
MSLVAESNDPVLLNNVGIHMISKGRYDQALRALSKALSLIKLEMIRLEETSKDTIEDDDNESPPGVFLQSPPECGCTLLSSLGVEGYTFTSPMYISAHQQDMQSFRDNVKLSFVILYNIALAHHLIAIQDANCKGKFLKAKSLYELVCSIQINEELAISPLQSMAISNNLGQIHLSLGDEVKSRSCFEQLLSTIISFNAYEEHDSIGNLDGFIGNVLLLFFKSAPTAPAA